jgi:hypothetical protein
MNPDLAAQPGFSGAARRARVQARFYREMPIFYNENQETTGIFRIFVNN